MILIDLDWARDDMIKCQLTIFWMSSIKERRYMPRLVSVNLLAGVWPPSCATLCIRAHEQYRYRDNHEKLNSWVSFAFLYGFGSPLWSSALGPFGPPELRWNAIKSRKAKQKILGSVLT